MTPIEKQIKASEREIHVRQYTVGEVFNKLQSGQLTADFCRKKDDALNSEVVEDVMLGTPLFISAGTHKETLNIFSGIPSFLAIMGFMCNEYALIGLEKVPALNGLFFKDLPASIKRKLMHKTIVLTEYP